MGDFNIDYKKRGSFDKHRLYKGLKSMCCRQLVEFITRLVSGACLDHLLTSHPERSDHLPVFAVRKYARSEATKKSNTHHCIRYRSMKNLNEAEFQSNLRQAPWDTVFLFDDIDDILYNWESLFNSVIDPLCLWRVKRVTKANQVSWLNGLILRQLETRDACLKTAKPLNTSDAWTKYRKEKKYCCKIGKNGKNSCD